MRFLLVGPWPFIAYISFLGRDRWKDVGVDCCEGEWWLGLILMYWLRSWKKPAPLSHKLYYKWKMCVKKRRKPDRGWGERWLTWNVNVCGKILMDSVVLSSPFMCVWEGKMSRVMCEYLCAYSPLCVSTCMLSSKCMNIHKRWPLSVESDHPMIGDHWKIEQIFPNPSFYGNGKYKKWMPLSEVPPQSFFW